MSGQRHGAFDNGLQLSNIDHAAAWHACQGMIQERPVSKHAIDHTFVALCAHLKTDRSLPCK